ncbi:MAG: response regulator [Caulobacteraceae bacterium]
MSEREPRLTSGMPPEHLAALSHELRTPLNGVIGMTRLLEGTRLTAEQKAYVGALIESGEHLLGLVNDVLDYARLGAGAITLNETMIDPENLLRSVCELMSPRAHDKGLEIGWAVDPAVSGIVGDEVRLKQILLNFTGNAVKFVDGGGVLLTAEPAAGRRLRFTVMDTGPGVPAAARGSIFEAFTQVTAGPQAPPSGAGLGLAIARRIGEAMGGEIGVSETPGGGASFWFEGEFAAGAAMIDTKALAGQGVAIASPSAIVRQSAARMVEASGGVCEAGASIEAVRAGLGPGDVLLIDHACAPAPAGRAPRGWPAVVLLRPGERGLIADYRQAGFAGYLIKPLRRTSLIARIRAASGAAADPPSLDDERIDSTAREAPAASSMSGARILLAEDNPINAMLAGAMLRKQGCRVDHVADGAAAVAAACAQAYDLVLMDMRMPVMGGVEATLALRARGIETPVVALTANAFDDDRRACLAAGMDDFLVKPLGPEGLRAAVSLWTGPGWTGDRPRAKLAC